jgi:hypothetical protein
VYFAAIGVLAANANALGEHAENRGGSLKHEAENLYEWHKPTGGAATITFVSRLRDLKDVEKGGDEQDWAEKTVGLGREKVGRVSGDGSTVLFERGRQLYRYRAGVEGAPGSLLCVSCQPGGGPTRRRSDTRRRNRGRESTPGRKNYLPVIFLKMGIVCSSRQKRGCCRMIRMGRCLASSGRVAKSLGVRALRCTIEK